MPISNDNQDFGRNDETKDEWKNEKLNEANESKLTSDDLKGKKVDADPSKQSDQPSEQKDQ